MKTSYGLGIHSSNVNPQQPKTFLGFVSTFTFTPLFFFLSIFFTIFSFVTQHQYTRAFIFLVPCLFLFCFVFLLDLCPSFLDLQYYGFSALSFSSVSKYTFYLLSLFHFLSSFHCSAFCHSLSQSQWLCISLSYFSNFFLKCDIVLGFRCNREITSGCNVQYIQCVLTVISSLNSYNFSLLPPPFHIFCPSLSLAAIPKRHH